MPHATTCRQLTQLSFFTLGGSAHTHMNSDIKAIVDQFPTLSLQVNIGERHRIMRSGIKRGSLWIAPRVRGYNVIPTGEAEALLYHFLRSIRVEDGGDYKQRWKYWNISELGDVARIIQRFAESSLL
jgi:hypothetical protein